jgi:hypothetical protein
VSGDSGRNKHVRWNVRSQYRRERRRQTPSLNVLDGHFSKKGRKIVDNQSYRQSGSLLELA